MAVGSFHPLSTVGSTCQPQSNTEAAKCLFGVFRIAVGETQICVKLTVFWRRKRVRGL